MSVGEGVGLKVGGGSRCQWGKGWGSRWVEGAGVSGGRGGAQGGWREQVSVGKGWGSSGWREQVSVGKGWGSRWVEGGHCHQSADITPMHDWSVSPLTFETDKGLTIHNSERVLYMDKRL